MNELQIFQNERFGEIRTIEVDGRIEFCGIDAARALRYANPSKAVTDHCRWVTKREVPHPQSVNKTMEMNFISEGDLYRLVAACELPEADEFESWIFDDVLPTLRQTGSYIVNTCPKTPEKLGEAASFIKVAGKYMEKQGSAPHEITAMIKAVSDQIGLYLPDGFVKQNPYQLTLY